jgi:hypothetical protein
MDYIGLNIHCIRVLQKNGMFQLREKSLALNIRQQRIEDFKPVA